MLLAAWGIRCDSANAWLDSAVSVVSVSRSLDATTLSHADRLSAVWDSAMGEKAAVCGMSKCPWCLKVHESGFLLCPTCEYRSRELRQRDGLPIRPVPPRKEEPDD